MTGGADDTPARTRHPRLLVAGALAAALALLIGIITWVTTSRGSDRPAARRRSSSATARLNAVAADPATADAAAGLDARRREDIQRRWMATKPPQPRDTSPWKGVGSTGTPAADDLCTRSTIESRTTKLQIGDVRIAFPNDPSGDALILRGKGSSFGGCPTLATWWATHDTPSNGVVRMTFGPRTVARCDGRPVGPAPGPDGVRHDEHQAITSSAPPPRRPVLPLDGVAYDEPGHVCLGDAPSSHAWEILSTVDALARYDECVACDFANQDLSGLYLGHKHFSWTDFSRTRFHHTSLEGSTIASSGLRGATFDDVNLSGAKLLGARFDGAGDSGVTFVDVTLDRSTWVGVDLAGTRWLRTKVDPATSFTCTNFDRMVFTVDPGPSLLDAKLSSAGSSGNGDCRMPFEGALLPLAAIGRAGDQPGRWTKANLGGAMFVGSAADQQAMRHAHLKGAPLAGIRFLGRQPDATGVDLAGATLTGAHLDRLQLFGPGSSAGADSASLAGADLQGATLRSAGLQHVDLRGAKLMGSSFSGADLSDANLTGAFASNADLRGIYAPRAVFGSATLRQADLRAAHLIKADFTGTNLTEADLSRADLSGSTFKTDARLSGARLDGTVCVGCTFEAANLGPDPQRGLTGASLTGAYLYGATMRDGSVSDVDLTGAMGGGTGIAWKSAFSRWEETFRLQAKPTQFPGAALMAAVRRCPDGEPPTPAAGCSGDALEPATVAPPPACRAAGPYRCPGTARGWAPIPDPIEALTTVPGMAGVVGATSHGLFQATWSGTGGTNLFEKPGITAIAGRRVDEVVVATAHEVTLVQFQDQATRVDQVPVAFEENGASKQFRRISDVAVLPDGDILVADPGDLRVWRVDVEAKTVVPFAGDGDPSATIVTDQPAVRVHLRKPTGLAVDDDGATYIADPGAHRVWKVDDQGILTAFAGTGAAGYATDADWSAGQLATGTPFSSPSTVAILPVAQTAATVHDRPWTLVVGDTGNHLIRTVSSSNAVHEPLLGVAGTSGSFVDGIPAATAKLSDPGDLLVRPDGQQVLVLDRATRHVAWIDLPVG